jgi:hypothetical protein
MSLITNLKTREEEVIRIAQQLQELHKVAGGVCVLFIEDGMVPFGFSTAGKHISDMIPARLREVADAIEERNATTGAAKTVHTRIS